MAELEARSIRLMGIEGADPSWLGPGLPPLLKGGPHGRRRESSQAVRSMSMARCAAEPWRGPPATTGDALPRKTKRGLLAGPAQPWLAAQPNPGRAITANEGGT